MIFFAFRPGNYSIFFLSLSLSKRVKIWFVRFQKSGFKNLKFRQSFIPVSVQKSAFLTSNVSKLIFETCTPNLIQGRTRKAEPRSRTPKAEHRYTVRSLMQVRTTGSNVGAEARSD